MTLRNPTNTIIAQAITSAIDGVLAKSQHELRGLLRDFCETTAHIFTQQQQQRITQIFEKDGEDDVSESLWAKRNHNQIQVHALEDPHDQVRDFVGEPIYDDYDDDFLREPCHKSDVMSKGGTTLQRNFLSLIDIHDINSNMTRKPLLESPLVTSNVESYYVPVTNLTDGPIYDVSADGVFSESYYYKDTACSDGDQVQSVNNGRNGQVVVIDASIGVRKHYRNCGLGGKDGHRQSRRKPRDRDRNKGRTYEDLVATHQRITSGSKPTKLLEETRRLLKLDHETCFTVLSLMAKHALEYKITFLMEALALEKEKNRNLEYGLNDIHKKISTLNKRSASLDMNLSLGKTEKSTMGLGYQGDSSKSQTTFVRGKTAEQNNTRIDLNDKFSGSLECIDANGCLQTENKFSLEPVYGICKKNVRMQEENTLTTYHAQFLSGWNKKIMKPNSLRLLLLCCCSTFYRDVYRTRVVVLKTCVVSVSNPASVSVCWSFSWIIHTTRTLRRVDAVVQRKLLTILVTRSYHCAFLQQSIIWEAWIWVLPPPLVADASRRGTEIKKSEDARHEEMSALAVMECLNFRARLVLVLPRFVVQLFLTTCLRDRGWYNLGIIWKLLLAKRRLRFYGQRGCATVVCFSSQAGSSHEGSNYKDTTTVCWSDFACVSSKPLFGPVSGAARNCLYFAVFSFGCPLVDFFHLVNHKVRQFMCVVAFSPIHVLPLGYCWILVITNKVPCYCYPSVDRWDHTFSIILNIIVGDFVFFMEHYIDNVKPRLVQVKKIICMAYCVLGLLIHCGNRTFFVVIEGKMFSFVRSPRSSLALASVDFEFVLVILTASSDQVDVSVDHVQSPMFQVGSLALGIAPDVKRNSSHKEFEGFYGKLTGATITQ